MHAVDIEIAEPRPAFVRVTRPEIGVPADAGRVRRHGHGAARVDDLRQPRAGQVDGAVHLGSQQARCKWVGIAVANDRRRGDVLGDRDHALSADLAKLLGRLRDRNRGHGQQHHRDHNQLKSQELAGQTATAKKK